MSPRDTQRSRVYKAEASVFEFGQTIPDKLLQATANEILDKRAIRARWPMRRITVDLGRNGARARGMSYISMGVSTRNHWLLCHEIAHCLTPSAYAGHGPEWVGVYLFLIDTVLGKAEGARLRAAFRAHRVKWNSKAVHAPSTGDRVPPKQYETVEAVRKRLGLPTPEQAAKRSAAARKAAVTRKANPPAPLQAEFPLRVKIGPKLAEEMHYQHDVTCDNAEWEKRPHPAWRVVDRTLIMDDVVALDDAMYRLDIVRYDESPGLGRAASSLLDRLSPVLKQATGTNH